MPSHLDADRTASQEPGPGTLDALITQARRLRGGIDAVRPQAADEDGPAAEEPARRWRRALCDLAVHHLDDLGAHLGRLRAGVPAQPGPERLTARVGSAEWNLLTDEVSWSQELYAIFGRPVSDGPLSLDELPSWVLPEDQPLLSAAVTDCLVDGRPIDREFRILRTDGAVRTVHLLGEPVLDGEGGTAAMWAVLRDVSELRRSERAVRELAHPEQDGLTEQDDRAGRDGAAETAPRAGRSGDGERDGDREQGELAEGRGLRDLRDRRERSLAAELQERVLPSWRGPAGQGGALDIASHYLPAESGALIGGDWYDALELPGGATLLSAGELTGQGVAAASGMAMLLGAVRGMAFAGMEPAALMDHLNQLLDASAQPALGSAVCCRYDPLARSLVWAQAGHPAPLLFRGGEGRVLDAPRGVLLGAAPSSAYGQRTEVLEPGDLVVLHTDGLAPCDGGGGATGSQRTGPERLLGLADRFAEARSAQQCVRAVLEEFSGPTREDDACVLIARVTGH